VLGWVVTHRQERELREAALQNASTTDEAIEALAASLPTELAELVVINQVRLLRRTPLLEALETNPNLNNDQRRRLNELRETFKIGVAEEPQPTPKPAPEPEPKPEPEPEPAPEPEAPASEEEAMVHYLSEEERDQAERVTAVQKIYRLNVAEKIITGIKGTREERAILIRDPNRLVASAVLGSPQLTEAEIESFSAMKNVSDDVLRKIGNHREWTKRYQVVSNLVKNPRTPIAVSMGLVSRMNPRDMKSLAVDRNVPEAVRKQAQKFVRKPGR
jgi:outer membrane biosynthesis protein TonB